MKNTITKEEAIKILKKELDEHIRYNCFTMAMDILQMMRTIYHDIPFIQETNFIRDMRFLRGKNKEDLKKVRTYLKKNKLWEVF